MRSGRRRDNCGGTFGAVGLSVGTNLLPACGQSAETVTLKQENHGYNKKRKGQNP